MSHSKYPASVTYDDIKLHCFAFGKHACPYAKLKDEAKRLAANCPAFKDGNCPFKSMTSIGEIQAKLGSMRDKHIAKYPEGEGNAAAAEFFKAVVRCSKQKAVDVGSTSALFNTISGCPFAKDANGKPIFTSDHVVWPYSLTMEDLMLSCPVFGKGICPYKSLINDSSFKGIAAGCPRFKEGCPFKKCKTVGEIEELLSQMRNSKPSLDAYRKINKLIHDINEVEEDRLKRSIPFGNVCPFSRDAEGKAIIPK